MLLDLKLKDVAGRILLERLEEKKRLIPFIVITGQGDEKVAVEMMKRGALDYVMKDTAMLELLPGVVRRALTVIESERVLVEAKAERSRLQREVIAISEKEQRRIGADLHDGLGQQLTALELMCAALRADTLGDTHLASQVNRIAQGLREAVAHVRALAHGLVPVNEDPDALHRGLIELVDQIAKLGGTNCRLECPEPVLLENQIIAGHLYRIAQEALNNALKHSQATEVVVALSQTNGNLRLSISDNGSGLSTRKRRGIGFAVMKHRASEIGAKLTIESRRNRGVTVTCTLEIVS